MIYHCICVFILAILKTKLLTKWTSGNSKIYLQKDKNVWSAIPGKFTLAFSMAPEFYRIVYQKNPRKFFQTFEDKGETPNLVAETVWEDSKN